MHTMSCRRPASDHFLLVEPGDGLLCVCRVVLCRRMCVAEPSAVSVWQTEKLFGKYLKYKANSLTIRQTVYSLAYTFTDRLLFGKL